DVDHRRTFGLLALAGLDERVVGHAFCVVATDGDHSDVALAVADDYRGRGLGTILLGQLAEAAAANGVRVLEATVLPENYRMLEVLRQSGFPVEFRAEPGQIHVSFPSSITEEARAQFERREQVAAANALRWFFAPRAVAVVGASRQRGTIGGETFQNLLRYGFDGPVYPVNPAATVVQSVPAYPSLDAIPGPVDLAVVAVPAAQVIVVAEQCARKGVRALVVISAGFAEIGEEGRARQTELARICRRAGVRLIGPNCLGILNTDPAVRLNATFATGLPPEGRVGFFSQSGALGLAIMDYAGSLGLGLSTFVSVGNKADISGNDLLGYWESDPRTEVILLYVESFGNPRKFSRIARRVGRRKPIVAVKSGRTRAGARAAASHTGALLAASDVTVDALFRQAGVIRVDTLEELFDVATLLAHQPVPRGRRVGIITNSGGPAILCADTLEAEGLEVPILGADTQARLRVFLPREATVSNPVDMIASATAAHYREAIRIVGEDPGIDALIVIFIPPLVTRATDAAQAIVDGARALGGWGPLLTVFMSARGVPDALRSGEVRIPSYAFPEDAARALARVARYGEWRARPERARVEPQDLRREEAAALVATALQRGAGWLAPDQVAALLACYGLPVAPQRVASSPEEAGSAAGALGGAVALKAIAPGLVHKTEAGAVRLHLRGADEVRAAAEDMVTRLAALGHPPAAFLVQEMAPKGVEMIVGLVHDAQFGPVVACGAGGVLVELLGDVSVRLAPLGREDAGEMVRGLRSYPLLTGFRGAPACDVPALEDALLRVSALAEDLPEVAELDCNPIIVHEKGALVIDARARVAPAQPPPPLGARG
ncbi:MAG: GNAT family N-acetyltransferase, partial [Candidatus Rokubacteria bacterium]|nr:GNAT family N-acetyltransferase [Candidatus Rokubacteria bacterium]